MLLHSAEIKQIYGVSTQLLDIIQMICLKIFQSCLLQDITDKPTEQFSLMIAFRHVKYLKGYEQIYLKLLGTSFAFL